MGTPAKITVDLETRSTGWTKGLGDAGKDVKQFVGNAERSFKALTMQAGAANFATAFASVAKGAEELATAFRTGEKGYGDLVRGAVGKIPIVGQMVTAGEAIRELITGSKAAAIELAKVSDHLDKLNAGYHAMALNAAGRGKYGDEKAALNVEKETQEAQKKIQEERAELTKKYNEIEKKDANIGWYSAAQKAEMKRILEQQKMLDKQVVEARKDGNQKLKDLDREKAESTRQFMRGEEEAVASFEAKAKEKSLRKQGKGIDSALVAVDADAEAKIRAERDKVTDYALEGKSDAEKAMRKKSVEDAIKRITADAATERENLVAEASRRDLEQAKANEEKLKEIQSKGSIDRLKIQDEILNEKYAKEGKSQRSHLAEAATIEEEYRKQIAEIDTKYRSEHRTNTTDLNDPNVKAQMKAAAEERKQALGLQDTKSAIEAQKNQNDLIKEQRKLWEEVGEPQDKYRAKLDEINEQFNKFHNQRLKDAQTKKLEDTTLEELKKLNPDHTPKVDLYNRTQGYANIPTGNSSTDMATKQLEELKKQNKKAEEAGKYLSDIAAYFSTKLSGVIQEISI